MIAGLLAALADVARYYYYLGYYLLFGLSRFPAGSHDMCQWCLAIMLRCQNESSPWLLGRSIVAHEILIAIQDRYRPVSRLELGLFQVVLPLGVLLYPLLVALWLPIRAGSFKCAWFKYMLRDIFTGSHVILTAPTTTTADLLDRWCAVDRYATGYHHGAIHILLYNRYPGLHGFKQGYDRSHKQVLAQECLRHGIPHPPTLHVSWDPQAEPVAAGADPHPDPGPVILKPALGWRGYSAVDGGHEEIFFAPTVGEAAAYVARHPNFIAQRCVRNIPAIARLWGDSPQALGVFRMYTGKLGDEIELLSSCWLRFPDPVRGFTDRDSENHLFVNVDEEFGEFGRVEEYHDGVGDTLGRAIEATGERWEFMPALAALVLRAHRAIMPGIGFVAWDAAMTTDGPMLIEVNVFNDIDPFTLHRGGQKFARQTHDLFFAALNQIRGAAESAAREAGRTTG